MTIFHKRIDKTSYNKGFSLIELSITLAVVALIIGAITAGSNLLQASAVDQAISEIHANAQYVESFRLKYNAFPGDMPTATNYWGTYNSSTNPEGTTNGDGNERIDTNAEAWAAWQQLARSNIAPGHYTGQDADGAGSTSWVAGTNVPESATYNNMMYLLSYFANYYGTTSGNILQLGSFNTDSLLGESIKPADAYTIDRKIDDGIAYTGSIYSTRGLTFSATAGRCTTNNFSSATGDYILTDNTVSCRLIYWITKN